MGEPRYYVRYQCRKDGPQLPATHFAFVRDSWYCHRDIRRFEQTGGGDGTGNIRQMVTRQAEALCAQLNADHDAVLATEGTASR